MKIRDWSVTDLIAIVSAVALVVTVASQAYFYLRLNALWVMSILSPSVYFVEVIKVLCLTSILIVSVPIFEFIYNYLIQKFLGKRKIIYKGNSEEIKILLHKKRKKYVIGFTIFSIFCMLSIFGVLHELGLPVTEVILFWISFIFGLCLSLFTNNKLDIITRRITIVLIVIFVTALNAELKIAYLKFSPTVYLKNNTFDKSKKIRLLESYQDKVVTFEDQNSKLVIRVLKIDQVDRIEEYKEAN
ncbi:hypothetical protein [Acinetobacter sp. SH20PTE14]|uniref:hypothetical protein n=1 Tax=Acinetobacter sp. SH20PTE14 TaxID=2905879 RepID=UPI001F1ED534|nr:hypothetical protein [Acinetobacter sp. SH20PTE14]UIJ76859.1 hypothetical protein LXF01_06325 [Acinetobacter sp. SH20PTE14]